MFTKETVECDMCKRSILIKDGITHHLWLLNMAPVPMKDDDSKHFCDKICLSDWVNKSLPIKN